MKIMKRRFMYSHDIQICPCNVVEEILSIRHNSQFKMNLKGKVIGQLSGSPPRCQSRVFLVHSTIGSDSLTLHKIGEALNLLMLLGHHGL